MKIEIGDTRIRYSLEFYGKYSVIAGDSGIGKTTFYELVQDYNDNPRLVKCKSDYPLIAVDKRADESVLEKYQNSILVMDEDCKLLKSFHAGSLFKASKNYFIIISRKNMNWLPLSVDNYYQFRHKNGINYNIPVFARVNQHIFSGIEQIVTEDQESGKAFFEEYFPDIPVYSAHSKSEMVDYLKKKAFKGKTLLVYDAAAFAYELERLQQYISYGDFSILDWECFENFVLRSDIFNIVLTQKDCAWDSESLEQKSTEVLENLIPYKKSGLCKCLRKKYNCGTCPEITMCQHKHDALKFELAIKGVN